MRIIRAIRHFFQDPAYRTVKFALRFIKGEKIPDKLFLQYEFHYAFGYKLDLKHPATFNEKLQWLKLYNRNPLYTTLVDKYEVKRWVAERIGERYIIPTVGVYDTYDDIDFDSLPDQFVIKCTHDSGSTCICLSKESFDTASARKKITDGLKSDFYLKNREWPYHGVKPRVIIEKYCVDKRTNSLNDYKFFCFDGVVRAMFIATERQNGFEETRFDFFDGDFNHLDIMNGHPCSDVCPEKPESFDEMKVLAETLSSGIPFVRVDFFEADGKVYFGEMTFFHWGGFMQFSPFEWDRVFGDWINLPSAQYR